MKNRRWRKYPAVKKGAADYHRRRAASDPSFRLASTLRRRLRDALKGKSKSASTRRLLGTTFDGVRKHLESRFLPGMSWDNYGAWHVDHVIPCAAFELTNPTHQQLCFHYKNLQPLWAEDNLRKSASLPDWLA
jgi:hypothetical protein